ncbi:helix-turn-helix domain-containing protein [Streptomyces sp. NPDC021098]|uniref:helix-turn-helix domain-containing protein n=1 Tax=unclassified Streptomyces TaxID=2593676 RepID=UPI00378FDABD
MRGLDNTAVGTPIGTRLASWRRRRGLSPDDLASRAGLELDYVTGLETGREWMDRRGRLAALAAALRLDVADLTGQPYPPHGEDHAAVRAVAFHLRHRLDHHHPRTAPSLSLEDLEERIRAAVQAEAAGDERQLALTLPGLIEMTDRAVAAAPTPEREETQRLRVQAHVLGAGLLRRLGYKDLAWVLLHKARAGTHERLPMLVEEVRLLIELGLPQHALTRVHPEGAAGWELPALGAVAQAMVGRRLEAEKFLATASARATDARESALVVAARAAVAAEYGDSSEASDHARSADQAGLGGAHRSDLLVVAAGAEARQGRAERAVTHLVEADAEAPLRLRLAPFAQELITALANRATSRAVATQELDEVRVLAERAGLR